MKPFDYELWSYAREALVLELVKGRLNGVEIRDTLNKWFKKHMFEVGVEQRIDHRAIHNLSNQEKTKFYEYNDKLMAKEITSEILIKGLFTTERRDEHYLGSEIRIMRALVFGCPDYVVPTEEK